MATAHQKFQSPTGVTFEGGSNEPAGSETTFTFQSGVTKTTGGKLLSVKNNTDEIVSVEADTFLRVTTDPTGSFSVLSQGVIDSARQVAAQLNDSANKTSTVAAAVQDNTTGSSVVALYANAESSNGAGTKTRVAAVEGDSYQTGAGDATEIFGVSAWAEHQGAGTVADLKANSGTATSTGAGTTTLLQGVAGIAVPGGAAGTVTTGIGVNGVADSQGTDTVASLFGVSAQTGSSAAGAITTAASVKANAPVESGGGVGTITNAYGVLVDSQSSVGATKAIDVGVGANADLPAGNWAIAAATAKTSQIRVTADTEILQLKMNGTQTQDVLQVLTSADALRGSITENGTFAFADIAPPGSPALGETWHNTNINAIESNAGTLNERLLGVVFTNSGATVGNTASETSLGIGALATAQRERTSNVAKLTLAAAHNLIIGQIITVSGVGGTGYNGTFTITSVGATTIDYASVAADEAPTADTGGTVVPNGSGSSTLPAFFLQSGKTFRVKAAGFITNTGTPTLRIKLKFGSVIALDTTAITMSNITGTTSWAFEGLMTCILTGVTGKITGQGLVTYYTTTTATSPVTMQMINSTPVTIDTASTHAIDITAQWGTANASNTLTATNFMVEILN